MSCSLDWWCSFVEPDNFQQTTGLHSGNKLLLGLDLLAPWVIVNRSQIPSEHFLYAFEDICKRCWPFLPISGNTIGWNSISNNALVFFPTDHEMLAPSSDAEEGEGSDTEAPSIFLTTNRRSTCTSLPCSGSLTSQEEVVMETQADSPVPRITREGTLLQEEDEEESPALFS